MPRSRSWAFAVSAALVFGLASVAAQAGPGAQCGPTAFSVVAGTSTATNTYARRNAAAVLLGNGKVLLVGGATTYYGAPRNQVADLYDLSAKVYTQVPLPRSVTGASATLLADGTVLIAGGNDVAKGNVTTAASIYDPATGKVTDVTGMFQARMSHTATLLPDGTVLIAGGSTDSHIGASSNTAELYDPAKKSFSQLPAMAVPRVGHTATLLLDGRVLLVSGMNAQLYDPKARSFSGILAATYAHSASTATRLYDGRVLLAGGLLDGQLDYGSSLAELFDPSTSSFTKLNAANTPPGVVSNPMQAPRVWHTATLLPSGQVLLAGGSDGSGKGDQYYWRNAKTTELFDPVTETFTWGPSIAVKRAEHEAVLLQNGTVALFGGAGFVSSVGPSGVTWSWYDYLKDVEQSSGAYCTGSAYQGCFKDDANRALPVQLMSSGATKEICTSIAAARGYSYAGLQWYGACYAGYTPAYGKEPNDSLCNTPCTANSGQACGGAWHSSLYSTGYSPPAQNAGDQGCYTDDVQKRALPALLIPSGATLETCTAAAAARGFAYAGLQAGGQCFGGNSKGNTKVDVGQCTSTCTANSNENCGGPSLNRIYATGVTPDPLPAPATLARGCYRDDANRALPVRLIDAGATPETCIRAARRLGYRYAGLQWYGQCWVGELLGYGQASSQCTTACTADSTQSCGGAWSNSVYTSAP